MNHTDLIAKIAEAGGISKADAKKSLELVAGTISDVLASGEEVRVQNFGTFKVKQNEAKEGRNPSTGAAIQIPARKVVKYSVAKPLAERVNA